MKFRLVGTKLKSQLLCAYGNVTASTLGLLHIPKVTYSVLLCNPVRTNCLCLLTFVGQARLYDFICDDNVRVI